MRLLTPGAVGQESGLGFAGASAQRLTRLCSRRRWAEFLPAGWTGEEPTSKLTVAVRIHFPVARPWLGPCLGPQTAHSSSPCEVTSTVPAFIKPTGETLQCAEKELQRGQDATSYWLEASYRSHPQSACRLSHGCELQEAVVRRTTSGLPAFCRMSHSHLNAHPPCP